jgi:hypothetical protein
MYSQTHLQNLVAQAELLLRRSDGRLYDNIQQNRLRLIYDDPKGSKHSVMLSPGRGSLNWAILFVLDRPSLQKPRALRSAAKAAYRYYRYYRRPVMLRAVIYTRPNSGSRGMPFETLTHSFARGEEPGPRPTVPLPGILQVGGTEDVDSSKPPSWLRRRDC